LVVISQSCGISFGTASGDMFVVLRNLIRNCFGSHIAIVRNLIRNGSGLFDLSFLRCICRLTGNTLYAACTYCFQSRGALAGSSAGMLADSAVGVLAIY